MKRLLSKKILLATLLVLSASLVGNGAQAQTTLVAITPDATDVSEQLPPLAQRLSGFGFAGIAGTDYDVVIETADEPALVVAVGADINDMSFDQGTGLLSVSVTYSGEQVLTDERVELPSSSFFIILDSGASPAAAGAPSVAAAKADKSTNRCFGPGYDLSVFEEQTGNFGDEEGLLEPEPKPQDAGAGFSTAARGAYASTNSFYWCALRPSGASLLGFELVGGKDDIGRLSLFLPDAYLAAQTGVDVSTILARQFAVFGEGVQISIDTEDVDAGVLSSGEISFEEGATSARSSPAMGAAARASLPRTQPATSANLQRKQLTIGAREPLSLAPDDLKPNQPQVELFGFVDDLALVGQFVEVVRLEKACGTGTQAASGTILARVPVQSNGSWGTNLSSNAIFPNDKKKSTLAAQITGDATRQSREVSLSNKNRGNRR